MSVLLNCPFCGGVAEHATSDGESPIICIECSASAPDAKGWNERHTLEDIRMAIDPCAGDQHRPPFRITQESGMAKQKVTLRVTEIIRHKLTVELDEAEIKRLRSVSEEEAAEIIGDYTSQSTIDDGRYEDPEID